MPRDPMRTVSAFGGPTAARVGETRRLSHLRPGKLWREQTSPSATALLIPGGFADGLYRVVSQQVPDEAGGFFTYELEAVGD